MPNSEKCAVIVGASSGIGEALARQLHRAGWRLGLMARREERLSAIAAELKNSVSTGYIDVSLDDCSQRLEAMLTALGRVDLVIIGAGAGYLNAHHDLALDQKTIAVNVRGFLAVAETAFLYFQQHGRGHLARLAFMPRAKNSNRYI